MMDGVHKPKCFKEKQEFLQREIRDVEDNGSSLPNLRVLATSQAQALLI